jgi:hypothetical protein
MNLGKFGREYTAGNVLLILFGILVFVSPISAQSTNLDYPTAITTGEISGRIKARDLGDSRLTSHYYIFETETGDVLLNIEASNLNGDIDVYTAGSMRPLLKASVYALGYPTVIQRQVYLRIPSRLILRVEGRTPNDDPGVYTVKFGGVFKAMARTAVKDPGNPTVSGAADDGAVARVSSVGTILEEIKHPEPSPVTPPAVAKNTAGSRTRPGTTGTATRPKSTASTEKPPVTKPATPAKTATTAKKPDKKAGENPKTDILVNKAPVRATGASKKPPATRVAKEEPKSTADPLEGVSLLIRMKDGTYVKYAMNDVLRVGVDKLIVTVILKNGQIQRLSLLDIDEMKIGQ